MPTHFPRFTLNRHLILLVPKQPVLDWLATIDDELGKTLTLDSLRDDDDGFLIPEGAADGTDEAINWVEKRWRMFLEHYLDSWVSDESQWPQKLSLKLFREWFDIEYHSMLWDLAESPLEVEDWDDDEDDGGSKMVH